MVISLMEGSRKEPKLSYGPNKEVGSKKSQEKNSL
jgi:hypothetical protein